MLENKSTLAYLMYIDWFIGRRHVYLLVLEIYCVFIFCEFNITNYRDRVCNELHYLSICFLFL